MFAGKIKSMLEGRFLNSYNDEVIDAMKWFDIKNWQDEKEYMCDDFDILYHHFKESLDHSGYESKETKKEWQIKIYS